MSTTILPTKFCFDADVLHAIAFRSEPAVNNIITLMIKHDLRYCFNIPHTVYTQLNVPETPTDVRKLLHEFLKTMPVELNSQEHQQILALFKIAIGNAQSKNIVSDLRHVAEAAKYGGFFITLDKRLLKRNDKVREVFPAFTIVNPPQALQKLREAIKMCRLANMGNTIAWTKNESNTHKMPTMKI